jgi:hypothetical protein
VKGERIMPYIATKNLYHSKTGKAIKIGEPVDLSHLDSVGIQKLLDLKAVTLVGEEPKKFTAPVKQEEK